VNGLRQTLAHNLFCVEIRKNLFSFFVFCYNMVKMFVVQFYVLQDNFLDEDILLWRIYS
jgi:hypothetical protein